MQWEGIYANSAPLGGVITLTLVFLSVLMACTDASIITQKRCNFFLVFSALMAWAK